MIPGIKRHVGQLRSKNRSIFGVVSICSVRNNVTVSHIVLYCNSLNDLIHGCNWFGIPYMLFLEGFSKHLYMFTRVVFEWCIIQLALFILWTFFFVLLYCIALFLLNLLNFTESRASKITIADIKITWFSIAQSIYFVESNVWFCCGNTTLMRISNLKSSSVS